MYDKREHIAKLEAEKEALWMEIQREQDNMGCAQAASPAPLRQTDPRKWAHEICAYHQLDKDEIDRIAGLRLAAETMIIEILRSCPPGVDTEQAIGSVRFALMAANAAIALRGI